MAPERQGVELELTGRLARFAVSYGERDTCEGSELQGKEALRMFGNPRLRMAPFTSKSAFG